MPSAPERVAVASPDQSLQGLRLRYTQRRLQSECGPASRKSVPERAHRLLQAFVLTLNRVVPPLPQVDRTGIPAGLTALCDRRPEKY